MSQENFEIVRRFNQAFNRRDMDAVAELLDPEVVYYDDQGSNVGTPSVLEGRVALLAALDQLTETFETLQGEIDELTTHWRGTGIASGVEVDLLEVISWKIESGVAVEGRVFSDREAALEAAGRAE